MNQEAIYGAVAAAAVLVIGAVGFSVKQAIIKLVEIWLRKLEEPKNRYYGALIRFSSFHQQLEYVYEVAAVERVLLFVGRNSGGFPDPRKKYTVSCIYGWVQDKNKPNPRRHYDFDLQVDRHYSQMLAEMVREGVSVQTYQTMPECMLKRYYQIEGVIESALYFVDLDPDNGEMLFASFASYSRKFMAQEIDYMKVRVDRMRAVLLNKEIKSGGSNHHIPLPVDENTSNP